MVPEQPAFLGLSKNRICQFESILLRRIVSEIDQRQSISCSRMHSLFVHPVTCSGNPVPYSALPPGVHSLRSAFGVWLRTNFGIAVQLPVRSHPIARELEEVADLRESIPDVFEAASGESDLAAIANYFGLRLDGALRRPRPPKERRSPLGSSAWPFMRQLERCDERAQVVPANRIEACQTGLLSAINAGNAGADHSPQAEISLSVGMHSRGR